MNIANMLLYFFILLSTFLIAQFAQYIKDNMVIKENIANGFLIVCFFILFLFSALRYKVGIDYISYERIFGDIRKGYAVPTEIGFNLIVKFVSQFTDNNYLLFAIFSFLTKIPIYKVIYKRSKDWGLSVFLFVSLGYYFFSYQNIRQYLAYMIALYALDKLIDKKYFSFIISSMVGILFHKSCAVIIPLYLIAQIPLSRILKIILFISGFGIVKCRNILRKIMFLFYPGYEGTVYDRINISYKNLLISICFFFLFILCCYNKKKKRELMMLDNLCLFSTFYYIFCWWIPETSRIGFFLLIPVCILLPNVLETFENIRQRLFLKVCICMGSTLLFYTILLTAYKSNLKLLPYQTWIDF